MTEQLKMIENPDDYYVGFISPEHWELEDSPPESDMLSIYIGHYQDYWLVPISTEAREIVVSSPKASEAEYSSTYQDDDQLPDNVRAQDLLWAGADSIGNDRIEEFLDAYGLEPYAW